MKKLILEIDETYRIDGKRTFKDFPYEKKWKAIQEYNDQRRGMVNLCITDDTGKSVGLLTDEFGRKYIKGSPFYNFPHVPHISKIDGKEIPST